MVRRKSKVHYTVECPECRNRIRLDEEQFNQYEIQMIFQATSNRSANNYYDK